MSEDAPNDLIDAYDDIVALHSRVGGPLGSRRPEDCAPKRADAFPLLLVKPGAADGAVQRNVMHIVRVAVYHLIFPWVKKCESVKPMQIGDLKLSDEPTGAAATLTAAYLRTFLPSWGKATTKELVRKSVHRAAGKKEKAPRRRLT